MNPRNTIIAILAALSVSLALAEDFKTINGKEYKNATISRVEPDGIVIRTRAGISKIYFIELPKEVSDKWLALLLAAQKATEEKRIEAENSAEQERAEKEKKAAAELAEKEKKPTADLKRAEEQFQAAEERATQSYRSAAKGMLSGQIFVSTRGGENFKLGAVQVSLFERDAVDAFIAAEKMYADFKVQQITLAVDAAKAAKDQADAAREYWRQAQLAARFDDPNGEAFYQSHKRAAEAADRARDEYRKIQATVDVWYSGAFYFAGLLNPIQKTETDADGRFVIEVPRTGKFVIGAQAERSVGRDTEHYYWLQPVSLEGQQQLAQNLSNNNLTSTTGSSSLIHTQDGE